MNKAYLKVNDKGIGMFPHERILVARDYNGNQISGFFDKTNIRDNGLEVRVISQEKDGAVILTPQLFLEKNSFICVKKSTLSYE